MTSNQGASKQAVALVGGTAFLVVAFLLRRFRTKRGKGMFHSTSETLFTR